MVFRLELATPLSLLFELQIMRSLVSLLDQLYLHFFLVLSFMFLMHALHSIQVFFSSGSSSFAQYEVEENFAINWVP